MPSAPPEPGLFSITTGCFSSRDSASATGRATVSATPPGGNGTIIVTGLSGQVDWAGATDQPSPSSSAQRTAGCALRRRRACMVVSDLGTPRCAVVRVPGDSREALGGQRRGAFTGHAGCTRPLRWPPPDGALHDRPPSPADRASAVCLRLAACAAAGVLPLLAGAQDYPTRPVRIIVPFAAGGPADVYRALHRRSACRTRSGQSFVVDNRPGAGSIIGTDAVAKSRARRLHAAADVEHAHGQRVADPEQAVPADARLRAGRADQLLRPRAGRQGRPAAEHAGRADPAGEGASRAACPTRRPDRARRTTWPASCSRRWPACRSCTSRTGAASGARTDVLGGQVDMMFDAIPTMTEHISAGKVKALGTTGKARSPVLPDVPTMAEAGVPGYEATIWLGLMAPKGTPPAIVDRLNAEITKIVGNARGRAGVGGAGRDADDDGRRRVHALPERRHREVGAHRQDLRREARPMTSRSGAARPLRRRRAGARQGAARAKVAAELGARVEGRFGAVGAMKEALLAGEPCDVMILTDAMIDDARRNRRAATAARGRPLGRVRTGVAVRSGTRRARRRHAGRPARGAARGRRASTSPTRCAPPPGSTSPTCCASSACTIAWRRAFATFPNGATAMRELAASTDDAADRLHPGHRDPRTPTACELAGALPREFELATVLHRRGRARAPPTASGRAASSRCSRARRRASCAGLVASSSSRRRSADAGHRPASSPCRMRRAAATRGAGRLYSTGADHREVLRAALGQPHLAGRPRICRTLAASRGNAKLSNRSRAGSNRSTALAPKSLTQTWSCAST